MPFGFNPNIISVSEEDESIAFSLGYSPFSGHFTGLNSTSPVSSKSEQVDCFVKFIFTLKEYGWDRDNPLVITLNGELYSALRNRIDVPYFGYVNNIIINLEGDNNDSL